MDWPSRISALAVGWSMSLPGTPAASGPGRRAERVGNHESSPGDHDEEAHSLVVGPGHLTPTSPLPVVLAKSVWMDSHAGPTNPQSRSPRATATTRPHDRCAGRRREASAAL
jgi:hypothetical protein